MKIQPRQHLLEIWRALAKSSLRDGKWVWGGRGGRNSIGDAEQLMCLMAPATRIDSFGLDRPDQTGDDVLAALGPLGDSVELPLRLTRLIADYLRTYTDEKGEPVFPTGSYLLSSEPGSEPSQAQHGLEVVDAFSISVQLALAAVGFLRVFRTVITRDELRREVDEVEQMASHRLTAGIVGLLRSFTVNVFDASSVEGRVLVDTVNQAQRPARRVVEELQRELRDVNAGLRNVSIGMSEVADLDNPNRLFECGWSWGVVRGAPQVELTETQLSQPDGLALPAPYLYFTSVALDGIQDLFTQRTRLLGLLTEEQYRLAQVLQVRWELTQQYWERVATFGDGSRWPLEDIPWRTVDEVESDYFTLQVAAIIVQALSRRPAADAQLSRVGRVLEDLGTRARITRRPADDDPAVALHHPGIKFAIEGADSVGGPPLTWVATDFSPQLLRRTVRICELLRTSERRAPMLELADAIWDHLARRRHTDPSCRLWDQPSQVYPTLKAHPVEPSWYYTQRVVDALVATAQYVATPPLRSPQATTLATEQLAEAEHLFDQEMLIAAEEAGPALAAVLQTVRTTLRRARSILPDRPATALVLANDVLRELERLAAARMSSEA